MKFAVAASILLFALLFPVGNEAALDQPSESHGTPTSAKSQISFTDVTHEAGIGFVHSFGDEKFSNLVEGVGAGAAWLDFDADGWIDLYMVTGKFNRVVNQEKRKPGEFHNRLYRNRGDGTFEDVTGKAGVGCPDCYSMGVSVSDFDNDGDPDIYVTNFGPNVLYRNRGDGTFKNFGRQSSIADPGCSVAATWLDFDRDGLLDLYVGNYIEFDPEYKLFYDPDGFPGPLAYRAQPDHLYRNLGNGRFQDVTEKAGIAGKGRAMSVAAADFDSDGFTDIYVTNDGTENFLYHNREGKRFVEIALTANVAFNGMASQTASMAVDFGDYDADGRVDIFVSDNSLSSLFRNEGERFRDMSPMSGIARTSAQFIGWGAFFFDFDNDGDLDIFKVNSDLSRLFGQEDQLFENLGNGKFQDVSRRSGPYFLEERMGRGAAFADYDNDGDPDIIIVNIDSPAVLLRNEGGNRNRSVVIRLVGKTSPRDGTGARVTVVAGGRTQSLERRTSTGYLSQNDPRLLFGLGRQLAAERIEVRWPLGPLQVLENVSPGKTIQIEEPGD